MSDDRETIDWPKFEDTDESRAILDAFYNQTVIERDGRKCLVAEAYVPKGSSSLFYRLKYVD